MPAHVPPKYKVAAVQTGSVYCDAPTWFDVEATLEKAIGFIEEAASKGSRLVVFPECFLPGYPYFSQDLNDRPGFRQMWGKFLWNSVEVPGPETDTLCAVARRTNTYIAMGLNERDRRYPGRMYNSVLYVGPEEGILSTHRKICNTVQERFFHTPGDGGENLRTVFPTQIGRLGGSICGEHTQFGLLYYWIMQGIDVHCSLWPGDKGLESHIDVNTRAMAFAGHCYAVLSSAYMSENDWPKNFYTNTQFNPKTGFRGGSGIVNPRGEYIAGPVYDKEEIVYADIDLAHNDYGRAATNLTGNYSRWDIISLNVRQEEYEPIIPMKTLNQRTGDESREIKDLKERIKELEEQVAALSAEEVKTPGTRGKSKR